MPARRPSPLRPIVAVVCAALAGAAGAVILGEYELQGLVAFLACTLYGVAIAELAVTVARRTAPWLMAALAVLVGGGLVWAVWISFNHFRTPVPATTWVAVAVGVVAAVGWSWSSGRRRRGPQGGTSGGVTGAGDAASNDDVEVDR